MSAERLSRRAHARALLTLGLPLIGSHVAQIAVGVTDTLMLGRYDVTSLAAGTLGSTLFFTIWIVGAGLAFAVMPLVAEAAGRGDDLRARRITRMGIWASVAYGAVMTPVLLLAEPILLSIGQEPAVAALAADYLGVTGWAMVPALIAAVLRSHLAALERTAVVLWVTVAAALANAALNWVLIFGNLGAPELGIRGSAIASCAVYVISMAGLALYAMRLPGPALFARLWVGHGASLRDVFSLGWPIGITNLAETGLFAASAVMMGWLGTVPLAAHGVAIQLASLVFIVHVGLSSAATVRAGRALGRGDPQGLARGGQVAIWVSLAFAIVVAATFVLIPGPLIGLFLSDDEPARGAILADGAVLLGAAALFHVVDALQVMALGLLRGVQDTRAPMWIAAFSYWVVGMPVAYGLGFAANLGGLGIWLGLGAGLALAALLLMERFWRRTLPALARRAVPARAAA